MNKLIQPTPEEAEKYGPRPCGLRTPTLTFEKVEAKLKSAIDWIEARTQRKVKGRLRLYLKVMGLAITAKNDAQLADKLLPTFKQVIPDIFRIVSVYEAFHLYDLPWISQKLELLFRGVALPAEEPRTGGGVQARSTKFELVVGSILIRDGWSPLPEDDEGDGIYGKLGHVLRVEAKRVQSVPQINKKISEAEKQLKLRQKWVAGKEPFGLIALDLTRLVNNGEKYLTARTEKIATWVMHKEMLKACATLKPRPFDDPLILGAMLYSDAPVLLTQKNQLTHVGQLDFLINGSKTAFYGHIAEKLFRSIKGISRPTS